MNKHFLHDFLTPESIAIYGANNSGAGLGSIQLMNIIMCGYKGKIFPIHLKLESVMGYKAYKSISEVPQTPDLVIVVLPPKIVPKIFKECGEKGVKRLILISGGFSEVQNDSGEKLEEEIQNIANNYGMRFIGPNCLGFYNNWMYPSDPSRALNTSIWEKLDRGYFSIASQSGTLSSHIFFDPDNLDLGLSKSISIGNGTNIDIVDCLEYFKGDENTKVIGLYIEEIEDGKKFLQLTQEICPKKPILTIYVGGSSAGQRAIKSHTGSLAGNSKIYEAAFKESGVIQTQYVEEFLDVARLLTNEELPKGERIGIITNSGGPGAMIANHAEMKGLKVPEFSQDLQQKLKKMVPKTGSYKNPLDSTFDMDLANYYINLPKTVMTSGEIDVLIIYGTFGFKGVLKKFLQNERIANHAEFKNQNEQLEKPMEDLLIKPIRHLSKKLSIPVIYINPQNYSNPWSKKIREAGGTLFQLWDRPIRAINKVCDYVRFKQRFNENN